MGNFMAFAKVGVVRSAAVAAVEVSKAVRMRGVEAPDVQEVLRRQGRRGVDLDGPVAVDEEGYAARLRRALHPGLLG